MATTDDPVTIATELPPDTNTTSGLPTVDDDAIYWISVCGNSSLTDALWVSSLGPFHVSDLWNEVCQLRGKRT